MLVGKKNKDNELSISHKNVNQGRKPESKIIIIPLHNKKVTFEAIPHFNKFIIILAFKQNGLI